MSFVRCIEPRENSLHPSHRSLSLSLSFVAKTSCHSSCGNAGCLGPNDPNLCGSCVQIGTISTCDTTTSTTSTTSTTIPTAATSCTPTTVAAVLGVFFTLIAVELLLVACVYFGWRVLQKMKERGTGSFDVHAVKAPDRGVCLYELSACMFSSFSDVVHGDFRLVPGPQ